MFVANFVEIDRLFFSPPLSTDKHFVKLTILSLEVPKTDTYFTTTQLGLLYFLYTTVECEKLKQYLGG